MLSQLRILSIAIAVLLLGLICGFFYAYEVSVMRGFAILPDRDFIRAMQAVNATVRNAAFAVSFFGAALACVVVVLLHVSVWRSPAALCVIGAAVLYVFGGLLLTILVNVPLNVWLASLGAADAITDPAAVRARYEAPWVFWNQVRTLCSLAAFALMVAAFGIARAGEHRVQAERPTT